MQTSDAKIHINNIEFADYLETSRPNEIYQIFNFILLNLNSNVLTTQIGKYHILEIKIYIRGAFTKIH